MKINLQKFKDELNFVKAASERMGTIPILSFVLVRKVSEGVAEIIATDLDRTLRSTVEIEGIDQSFMLPTKKMSDLIGTLEGDIVEITIENNDWVKLKNGKAVFRMPCEALANYPEVPAIGGEKLRITAGLLSALIKNTVYAVTEEQSRFTLSGAKLLEADGEWRMVATDGHRMAVMNTRDYEKKAGANDIKVGFNVLIPRKALLDLQKLTNDVKAETEIIVGEDTNHLHFSVGSRVLQCRKLSGDFPNYHMVIPKGARSAMTINTQAMTEVLRRIALMADSRTKSVVLTFGSGEILISSKSSEEGEASETISVGGLETGDKIEIGFNYSYLMDVFRLADGEQQNKNEKDRELRLEYDPSAINGQWSFITSGLAEKNLANLGVIMPCRT